MLQDNKMTTICPIYSKLENKSENAKVLDDDFGPGSISSLEIGIKSIIFIFSQSMTSY